MSFRRFHPLLILVIALAIQGAIAEEQPVLLRSFKEVDSAKPHFEGKRFVPQEQETIAILGGTNAFEADRQGFLEARFHLAWPEQKLKFKCLAWQGDTIDYQARPRNYYTEEGDTQPGSVPDQREKTEPGIIFLWFGKAESLDGPVDIASFTDLIDQLKTKSSRLVLVAPSPFFAAGPAGELVETRNQSLAELVSGMRAEADRQKILFVDLFTPLLERASDQMESVKLSSNGIHLTEHGHRVVAGLISDQLEFPKPSGSSPDSVIRLALDQAIARKNRLWQQYYRPTNWAFLFGDRQHVPASRDPVERDERWFLREIESLPGLIVEAEEDIHRYAREAASKGSEKP